MLYYIKGIYDSHCVVCSESVINIERTGETIGFLYLKVQGYLIRH